jgi:putative thioredoxin
MTAAETPHAFDATAATFEAEVMARSTQTPVLVDFWAPWCAPCTQLKPVLEKLAGEYGGAFVLARVNSDDEMQLAALFGIRSLPTVMLLKGGRPVDGFMGAQPEGAVREFLRQHGIEPLGPVEAAEAAAVEVLDPVVRIDTLRAQLAAEPEQDDLKLELAVLLAGIGEVDEAQALLDALPAALAGDDRARKVRATLGFAAQLRDAPARAELERRLAADPADLRARQLLGVHKLVAGEDAAALEDFLELLRRDRGFEDGLPRQLLIDAFAVVADEDLVGRYRRRMASLLF